ncbi:MAG: Gfo/Idh/MocA family oxidoreductase [Microbacterium sp.]|nr:Gfo/Idh/MocA family oxidoreductase [Microbacterium sp.]
MPLTSSSGPLRVAVIGVGGVGAAHAHAFAAHPDVELVALADAVPGRRDAVAAELGVPRVLGDWREVLAADGVDAVSIALPNALHAPVTIAALEAGLHVLCEKPLATTVADARAMVDAARTAGRVLEVPFNHRKRGDVAFLERYLADPGIGEIYHVRASWRRRAGIAAAGWFRSRELAGGGALIDLGPHVLDLVLHLLGEPAVRTASAAVHGRLGTAGYGRTRSATPVHNGGDVVDVEDLASAFLRLDGGVSVQFEISWAGHAADDEDISLEILGVDGGVRLFSRRYATEGTVQVFRDVGGVPAVIRPAVDGRGGDHHSVVRDFVAAIRSGAWAEHDGSLALRRTEVLDAVYRSAATGAEVEL